MPFLLSFLSGAGILLISRYFFFSGILMFLAATAWLINKQKGRWIFILILGVAYALLRVPPAEQPWNKKMEITGRFLPRSTAPPSAPEGQDFVVERAVEQESGLEYEALEDEKIRLNSDAEFDADQTYELLVETGKDRTRLNPGGSGRVFIAAHLIGVLQQDETKSIFKNVFEQQRTSLHDYIMAHFGNDSADFLSAVTVGHVHFDDDLRKAFNATGLAHILSISGTHFGLLSYVLFTLFLFLLNRLPYGSFQRMTLYLSPKQVAAIICFPLMVLYLGISGGSIPAVRSFVMINLFLLGLLIGRTGFWLNTVLLAASVLVLWDPEVILTLTFQLSFIAVLFIGFSLEQKGEVDEILTEHKRSNALSEFTKNSLRLTLAATIGTAPLVAYHFHYISLISPLSNLIVAPLIGFVLLPLALISSFAYILTGYYIFGSLVGPVTDLSLWLVRMMAKIPFADSRIPAFPLALIIMFYAGFLLYFAWAGKKRVFLLSFLPMLLYAAISLFSPKELSVTFLDVGQGDSAVVELPDGKVLVVDTGRTGYEAANFLSYLGRRSIDALVISHLHPDHAGGIERLQKQFSVKEIWDSGRLEYPDEVAPAVRHRILERGDVVEQERYSLEVFHPYPEFYTLEDDQFIEENNASLVFRVAGRRHSFLFVGDVEEEAQENLLHLGKRLNSDVLKVPHHGGRSSADEGFLFEVSPSIAVISAGRNNSFGHPHRDMLDALAGASIYRTDQDGAIKITETEKGLVAKTYQDFVMERADSFSAEIRNLRRMFAVW